MILENKGRVLMLYREKGDSAKARDFLPADKQYLITRNGQWCTLTPASGWLAGWLERSITDI